jgi:transcriptional regulator with XRE-family HTH domain
MTTATEAPGVGGLLRGWRQRRRLSQLDLAIAADVSTRHLSFVETGRARPSREFVMHLAAQLEVPLREQNSLLLAAGYAPVYRQTPLGADEMAPVRGALDKIVRGHQPFPALVVDRRWDLVTANDAALDVLTEGVSAVLLVPPTNVLRVSLHPDGIAPRIANFTEWAMHLLERLDRQIAVSGDPDLGALAEELRTYPGVEARQPLEDLASRLFVPLVLRHGRRELRFFSTISTFGTALDITIAELAIESFFPADAATTDALAPHGSRDAGRS